MGNLFVFYVMILYKHSSRAIKITNVFLYSKLIPQIKLSGFLLAVVSYDKLTVIAVSRSEYYLAISYLVNMIKCERNFAG